MRIKQFWSPELGWDISRPGFGSDCTHGLTPAHLHVLTRPSCTPGWKRRGDMGVAKARGQETRGGQESYLAASVNWLHRLARQSIPEPVAQILHYEVLEPKNLFVSACATKFCHRDFVLKYVVIGGKKDFQEKSGLFRDLFWSRSGLFIAICNKMQNCF